MLTTTFQATTELDLTASLHAVTSITLAETGNTAAIKVYLRDGSATGNVLIPIVCPAGQTVNYTFPHPVRFPSGVYVNQITTSPFTGGLRWAVTGY